MICALEPVFILQKTVTVPKMYTFYVCCFCKKYNSGILKHALVSGAIGPGFDSRSDLEIL